MSYLSNLAILCRSINRHIPNTDPTFIKKMYTAKASDACLFIWSDAPQDGIQLPSLTLFSLPDYTNGSHEINRSTWNNFICSTFFEFCSQAKN